MMRRGLAGLFGVMMGIGAQPAASQDRSETYHIVCVSQDTPARIAYGADVISEKFATYREASARFEEVKRRFEAQTKRAGQGNYRTCKMVTDERLAMDSWDREIFEGYQVGSRYELAFGEGWVSVVPADIPKNWANIPAPGENASKATKEREVGGQKAEQASGATKGDAAREAAEERKRAASEAEKARIAAREAREAEFQAKLAAHEAQVSEYQRKVKAREAEIARQKAEHAAAQEKARQVQAAHAKKLAEAQQAREEWLAVKRRHDRCVGGDQQACADMAAGKPPAEDKLADAGEASTDTDANRCVTTAETSTNAAFKGNTSASVLNGCGQKVDVRICLKRTAGWNCATVWGVDPQARATHSSFNATGEVFVDARVSNSKRALASPGG